MKKAGCNEKSADEVIDTGFIPPAAELRRLRSLRKECGGGEFVFAWERANGKCFRFSVPVPKGHVDAAEEFARRAVKTALWVAGGYKLYLAGDRQICGAVAKEYAPGGARSFDRDMMLSSYGREVRTEICGADEVPCTSDNSGGTGISWDGGRIGFDLGASDFKISAVLNGEVKFSDEFPWDPRNAADPEYHFEKLNEGLKKAAAYLPHVDAIGGSTAGIVVDNQIRVASLFRAVAPEKYSEAQSLFKRVSKEWGVPVHVENDGDVTALAAYLSGNSKSVLGIAMGSSEAAGYIDGTGSVTGRLNELAFAPVDMCRSAPVDEWSGDYGVGAMYFSQQAVNFLASADGMEFPEEMRLPERLVKVQEMMTEGSAAAERIYRTIGDRLGHSVAWYREFYDFESLLILGRVTTGLGGEIIVDTAKKVVDSVYPELSGTEITMPDEKAKRLGQSVAAAALA